MRSHDSNKLPSYVRVMRSEDSNRFPSYVRVTRVLPLGNIRLLKRMPHGKLNRNDGTAFPWHVRVMSNVDEPMKTREIRSSKIKNEKNADNIPWHVRVMRDWHVRLNRQLAEDETFKNKGTKMYSAPHV